MSREFVDLELKFVFDGSQIAFNYRKVFCVGDNLFENSLDFIFQFIEPLVHLGKLLINLVEPLIDLLKLLINLVEPLDYFCLFYVKILFDFFDYSFNIIVHIFSLISVFTDYHPPLARVK